MKYTKMFIKRGLLGFPLGVTISATFAIFYAIFNRENLYTDIDFYILAYFCGGAMGALWASCSAIFEIEKWSLLKSTIIHFLCTMPIFVIISLIAGWTGGYLLQYILVGIAVYFITFLAIQLSMKSKIDKINKKLK